MAPLVAVDGGTGGGVGEGAFSMFQASMLLENCLQGPASPRLRLAALAVRLDARMRIGDC